MCPLSSFYGNEKCIEKTLCGFLSINSPVAVLLSVFEPWDNVLQAVLLFLCVSLWPRPPTSCLLVAMAATMICFPLAFISTFACVIYLCFSPPLPSTHGHSFTSRPSIRLLAFTSQHLFFCSWLACCLSSLLLLYLGCCSSSLSLSLCLYQEPWLIIF